MSAEPFLKNEKVHFWLKCVASKRLCSRTLKSPGNRRRLHSYQSSLPMSAALLWKNLLISDFLNSLPWLGSICATLSVFPEKRLGSFPEQRLVIEPMPWRKKRIIRHLRTVPTSKGVARGPQKKICQLFLFGIPAQGNAGIMNPKTPYLDLVWLVPWERGLMSSPLTRIPSPF